MAKTTSKRKDFAKREREAFTRFDAAEYLETAEDIAAYLGAAAEHGDAQDISRALGTVARSRGMSALARETGITREGLYKALSGDGNPSLDTVLRIVKALGVEMSFKSA